MSNKNDKAKQNKALTIVAAIIVLEVLFIAVYFLTTVIYKNIAKNDEEQTDTVPVTGVVEDIVTTTGVQETTTAEVTTAADTTVPVETTVAETTTKVLGTGILGAQIIEYPADDASWKMICLNRSRCVDASVENNIKLSKVAGTSIKMDSRAAVAYDKMYAAAAKDGIYLTPHSGYRSYSTQKILYFEFVNEYIADGHSESEAHDLASKRRNPPGSSEHNIGICMDIICAASSANFQNTKAYAWLTANAQEYGFILRYPEDKVAITGVKFEPWHWRYVGVENAAKIKASGLCLEEYLGLV